MKKILFFAIAAAAVMSCTKSEPVYTQAEEISFMPVSRIESKAAVQGTDYVAGQDFYVFANTTDDELYFSKILYKRNGETSGPLDVFSGDPKQYWPNVKSLWFAGYTQSGNTATAAFELGTNMTSLTVRAYTQPLPTAMDNQDPPQAILNNDFMYFIDKTGYAKGAGIITPEMKHACAWLTFNVCADAELLSYWTDLKITNISLKELYTTGDATFTDTPSVSWNNLTDKLPSVDILNQAKSITGTSVEFANIQNNTIVIPQDATFVYITYSYKSPAGTDITEVKEINLPSITTEGWDAGMHYVYNLTVTAEEIKIAPKSTPWDGTSTTVTTPLS